MNRHYQLEFRFLTKLQANCEFIVLALRVCFVQVWLLISGQIFRVHPIVLGTIPKPCKGHSVLLLSEDRILIIKRGSSLDDCIWFLEVGILLTLEIYVGTIWKPKD
jgi:hypothetical protein